MIEEPKLCPLGWWSLNGLVTDELEPAVFRPPSAVALANSQGWLSMAFRLGLSWGLILRQALIRSSQSEVMLLVKLSWALQMASSASKGMSPQTMSKRRMPRDQTVKGSALYWEQRIHSGGAYTLVPEIIKNISNIQNHQSARTTKHKICIYICLLWIWTNYWCQIPTSGFWNCIF